MRYFAKGVFKSWGYSGSHAHEHGLDDGHRRRLRSREKSRRKRQLRTARRAIEGPRREADPQLLNTPSWRYHFSFPLRWRRSLNRCDEPSVFLSMTCTAGADLHLRLSRHRQTHAARARGQDLVSEGNAVLASTGVRVESRCGAVAVGRASRLPPLSVGSAQGARPWLRFHITLIEPDVRYLRIKCGRPH